MANDAPIQPIACVIGHPIAGNPAQFAFERAFAAADVDWRFLSLDVSADDLADGIRGARALGFQGLLIAEPHRSAVAQLCDELSEQAAASQHVDVVTRTESGTFRGHHLKSAAISDIVARTLPEPDARGKLSIAMLGDCSIMRAAMRPLMLTTKYRWRVTEPLLDAPIDDLEWREVDSADEAIDDTTAVVIRGRQGADPADCPETLLDRIRMPALVIDIAETTSTSPLSRYAAQRGCVTLTRLDLLVLQTTAALEAWTGLQPDGAVIREALEEFLEI